MEILTMEQIATRKGVAFSTVRGWRRRRQLPEPDIYAGPRRMLWYRSTIDSWDPPQKGRRYVS